MGLADNRMDAPRRFETGGCTGTGDASVGIMDLGPGGDGGHAM